MNVRWSWYLLLVSLVAYVVCLPLGAFCLLGYSAATGCFGSWNVLIYGWMAMPLHGTHLIWLANPILLLAWLTIATSLPDGTFGQKMAAGLASSLALGFAACFLLPVGVVNNEGGVAVPVSSRAAGYWLWLASMLAAFASALLLPVASPLAIPRGVDRPV